MTTITFQYTNHRGVTEVRRVTPYRIVYGKTEWHPVEGWLLEGYDQDRRAMRSFPLQQLLRRPEETQE